MGTRLQQRPLVLVVRYGFTDKIDAAEELDKVIVKNGEAWFGKFGQRIGRPTVRLLESQGGKALVVLVKSRYKTEAGKYKSKTYELTRITNAAPPNENLFPPYYKSIMNEIRCWIGVRKHSGEDIDLARLSVRSSTRPVLQAFSSSMVGFFVCRLHDKTS